MSERYSKLFTLTENLYTAGSPVVIAAGALLKDNQTGKVLAQLKLRSISGKTVKAATVLVSPLDTVGKPLGEPVAYQYLDLHADRDGDFGQKAPIDLPDAATRSFTVSVTEVIFSDNSIWGGTGSAWKPLNRPKSLDTLDDGELAKQFRIEYGSRCDNLLLEQEDLWNCVCGALNHREESCCHKCRKVLVELQAIDMEGLQKKKDQRIAQERAEAEAAQKEAEIARKKSQKIGIIAAAVLSVVVIAAVLLTQVIIPSSKYKKAMSYMENGNYEEAIAVFESLGDFKDSVQRIEECNSASLEQKYNAAIELMNAGQYEEAITAFEAMDGYKDSNYLMEYSAAEEAESEGDIAQAAMLFGAIDYKDSKTHSMELWGEFAVYETISATAHTVGLKTDGTVVAVGYNEYGQCDVSDWIGIAAVGTGDGHTVGLKTDGTTVAVGNNEYGQCDVSNWTGIAAVDAGNCHTVGLKKDRTVVAVGNNSSGQCNVSDWTEIVAVSAGSYHTVGLKADGTVVATGYNGYGECNVSDWTGIVSISAGSYHTVGLKADGTVVATGYNKDGECDVSGWTEIIAINAGHVHTVALKAGGTVVAVGYNGYGQCNVSDWTGIVAISAGHAHTVGLKADGKVVTVGYNDDGRCDVSDWRGIKQPG